MKFGVQVYHLLCSAVLRVFKKLLSCEFWEVGVLLKDQSSLPSSSCCRGCTLVAQRSRWNYSSLPGARVAGLKTPCLSLKSSVFVIFPEMSHPESITLLPESCPWLLLFFFTKLAAAVPGAQELDFQGVSGLKARTNLFLFHLFLSKSFVRLCLPCGGKGAWLHPHSVAGEV